MRQNSFPVGTILLPWPAVMTVMLAASLALNVALGLKTTRQVKPPPRSAGVQVGDRLPLLAASTVDGQRITLSFDEPTLLYVFSPTCRWCMRDHANIREIQRAADPSYRFVAVTLNDQRLREYLSTRPYPGLVAFVPPDTVDGELNRDLRVTPQLLVVDAGGHVQRAWSGALFAERAQEAEEFFGVRLPGPARPDASRPIPERQP